MKKLLLSLAVVFGMISAANAQLVIGGNFTIDGNTGAKTWDSNAGVTKRENSYFTFGINPRVGYMLKNKKMEVGGQVGFTYSHTTRYIVIADENEENGKDFKNNRSANFTWNLTPYFRYRLLSIKGFGLWLEADMPFAVGFTGDMHYYAFSYKGVERTQSQADDMRQEFLDNGLPINVNWQLGLLPVATYTIKDHYRLEVALDLLRVYMRVDATLQSYKGGNGAPSGVTSQSSFGAGIGLRDKLFNGNVNTITQDPWFRLGFAYQF